MKPVLESINLAYGSHESPEEGLCLLEAVAYIAGEPHSDHPSCVCPVLAAFGRSWNDGLENDGERNRLLRPFIPKLIGTNAGPEVAEKRAWIALDWLIRVQCPTWMELTESLREHAEILRALPPQTSEREILASKSAREAAEDAAVAVAQEAAWAAARKAAVNAARVTAVDAARVAAGAAWTAARNVAWDARDTAWDAAVAAAWTAARTAAWATAGDFPEFALRSVIWNAVRDALKPTAEKLKESALDLFERMIETK